MSRLESLVEQLHAIHNDPEPAEGYALTREFIEDLISTLLSHDRRLNMCENCCIESNDRLDKLEERGE